MSPDRPGAALSRAYEPNAPDVAAEIIDGEAIILHLRNGHYFSAEGIGAFIWAGVEARRRLAEIAELLAARCGAQNDAASEAVEGFAAELLAHDLVRACRADQTAPMSWAGPLAFAAPRLEVYTDMEDIMRLDPIHEVDARGWPIAPDRAAP